MSDLFTKVNSLPIESVIREYFPSLDLKRAGRDLVTLCPFHSEDTASFHVYVEKNSWHCFGGCAKGGTVVDLLRMAGIASEPIDAAKALAEKFGIEIEVKRPARKAKPLIVAQYAEFCALPGSFLVDQFELTNGDSGVEIPYKNEAGTIISIQRRHKLEKGKAKDQRFSWHKGDSILPYGLWRLAGMRGATRIVVVEGASDVHVLSFYNIAALDIPGAGNFKPDMAANLLPFPEIIIIQEPGDAGEKFVSSITKALKGASYKGIVKALSLPEKDPRALWLTSKDQATFTQAIETAIVVAPTIDLYPPVPRTRELIDTLEAIFSRYVFFKEKRYPLLLALWVMGTYLHRLFAYFAYLHLNSPVLRCGKTLLLEIIGQLAAQATPRLSNASEAVIFRLADSGATMLLDELESLRNQDKEKFSNIMGLLNAGFQAGAKVPRAQKVEDRFEVVYFNAFCPKALAGINTLSDTLADRSLLVAMTRKTASETVDRFTIRRQGKELEKVRSDLRLWATEREEEIAQLYDGIDDVLLATDKLRGLDDRFLDIVEPLLTIAIFSDCEFSNGRGAVTERFVDLLRDMAGAKVEVAEDTTLSGLVTVLEAFLKEKPDEETIFVFSADLLARVTPELPWIESTRKLAGQLKKFGAYSRTSNDRKAKGYRITREWVKELRARYLPDSFEILPSYRNESNNNNDLGLFSCRHNDAPTTDKKET